MKTNLSGRKFQFWQYRVSHGELLIRSPRVGDNERNIDLMFTDVVYTDLPRFFDALEVVEADPLDLARAEERLGKPVVHPERVFVLECQGRRYILVATWLKIAETDMDIFESPFDFKRPSS